MISLAPGTKVFLACNPIDLRSGFNGPRGEGAADDRSQPIQRPPVFVPGQTRPTSDIQHTVFALPGLPIPGIPCSGRRCRYRRTVAGRICNVSIRTNGQTLAASCRPGCLMRATAQAWLSASRRSASEDYSSLPPPWSRSRLRRMAHDRILQEGRKKTVRRSPYRNPAQLALYPEHQIVERPLSLTPKGLIEALADLLLAAIGTPSGTIKGGDDEQ